MKPFLSFAALFLLLTPALAQQADQSAADQDQQAPAATAQPAAEQPQAGMSQADALAAAQDAEEQAAQTPEEQSGEQSGVQSGVQSGEQSEVQPNAEQYPIAPPEEAAQQDAPPPAADAAQQAQPPYYGGAQGREQNSAQQSRADQPYDQPNIQPLPERRTLQISPAIRPRAEAAAYPVYRQQPQLAIGAKLLSAREVEQKFSTPLGKRYMVVEVGVFPVGTAKLRPEDFTLRVGSEDQAFFPSTPEDVASALVNFGPGPRRGFFFPSVGVGYQNGPWGRGVSTGVGVGVAGGPRPYPRGPMGANRRVIESELRDKSLPQGNLTQPVAGYLYFPVKQKRNAHYNLELTRNGETLSLPLPASQD